jgi:hypothetical protein
MNSKSLITPSADRRPGGALTRSEEYQTNELNLIEIVKESGLDLSEIHPLIYDMFADKNFVASIPEKIKHDPRTLGNWLKNSTLFTKIRHSADIIGPVITIPETQYTDGKKRKEESGPELLLNKIKRLGVDPANVLYFRRTQPTENTSNPEHYWTSDYWETVSGLQQEIKGEKRENSVILCSTLEDIGSDSNLILDINDDEGLALRRVNPSVYDQKRILFKIEQRNA